MKIVYVLTQSDVLGGASFHVLDIAGAAQRVGHDVVILAGGHGVFHERARKMGLASKALDHLVREISPVTDARGILELRRHLKALGPDLVHVHSSKAGVSGRLAAKSLGIPAIFTAHGWAFTEGVSPRRRRVYRFIERCMARISSKIITVSEYDRRLALASGVAGEDMVQTIHNGIPALSGAPGKPMSDDAAVRLIMVARFHEPKDHQTLLKALNHVQTAAWRLELVGDGPLLMPARALSEALGLDDRVSFSGACDDVPERLAAADLFVLVSDWEGLPLSILEAMRAGLPVIASNVGGVSEALVDGETGFLVERKSVDQLADAISQLVASRALRERMGEHGKQRYARHFSVEQMVGQTLSLYREVAGRSLHS